MLFYYAMISLFVSNIFIICINIKLVYKFQPQNGLTNLEDPMLIPSINNAVATMQYKFNIYFNPNVDEQT